MPRDPRIDAYIEKSSQFAPILAYLRDVVHEGCPEVEETVKWGMPHFTYKGLMCGMAAFKEHCSFGFWKHELVVPNTPRDGMGSVGRIASLDDLPPRKKLIGYVRLAMKLNEEGVVAPSRQKRAKPRPAPRTPAILAAALKKSAKARATFAAFSPSHKREYIEWITEAKTDATRDRRVATAIEWMAAGKAMNWKYAPKSRKP